MAEDGVFDTVQMMSLTNTGPGPLQADSDLYCAGQKNGDPEQRCNSQFRIGLIVIETARAWRAFLLREKLGRRVDRIGRRAVELCRR